MAETERQRAARERIRRNLPWTRNLTEHTRSRAAKKKETSIDTAARALQTRAGKEPKPGTSHEAQVIKEKDEMAKYLGIK